MKLIVQVAQRRRRAVLQGRERPLFERRLDAGLHTDLCQREEFSNGQGRILCAPDEGVGAQSPVSAFSGLIPTVIHLQMTSTPDESAGYELSGKVTFSNTACFANATITRRARGRWLFPDIVSDTQRLELLGTMSDDLSTMNISYALVQGTCPELVFGDGRLVRR